MTQLVLSKLFFDFLSKAINEYKNKIGDNGDTLKALSIKVKILIMF